MFAKHWYLGEVWYITTKAVKPKTNITLLFSHPWDNNALTLLVIPAVCAGMVRDHITQPVKWMQYIIPLLTDVPQYFKPTERSFLKDTTWQGAKHYSGAALKGSFQEYFDWLILISSWGTASWAFIAMSWYSSFLASSESASLIFLPGKNNFTEQNWWNGGTRWLVSDGKCQLMHCDWCPWPLLFTPNQKQTVLWNIRDHWNKKPQYFTTHAALSAVPDLPPHTSQMQHSLLRSKVWREFGFFIWFDAFETSLFTRDASARSSFTHLG